VKYVERDAYGNPGDNRHCGFPTKTTGRPCRAHAVMDDDRPGRTIGCYLHDPRRLTYRQKTAIARHPPVTAAKAA
jgi:hypothetical protein